MAKEKDRTVNHAGQTYKFVAAEQKWYIRVASRTNSEWIWQGLNIVRVPKELKYKPI